MIQYIDITKEYPSRRKGLWKRRGNALILDKPFYEIVLSQCRTPSQICNWLSQVASKSWADDSILADLIRAFGENNLLRDGKSQMRFSKN